MLWAGMSAVAAVAVAGAVAACGSVAASAWAVSPSPGSPLAGFPQHVPPTSGWRVPAPPLPDVAIGKFTGREPAEIDFSADGGNIVTGLRWASWTAREAVGHGRSGLESCVPNCAVGPVRYVPATIRLSAPVNGKFTSLTEERAGREVAVKWPAGWPLGAS